MNKKFKAVSFTGKTVNTPDEYCNDGDLLEAVNLRFKDGVLKGVGDKVEKMRSVLEGNYSNLYYHPVLPEHNFIVFNDDTKKVCTVTIREAIMFTPVEQFALQADETLNRFSHLNNILLVFTDKNAYKLYWDKNNNKYIDLTTVELPTFEIYFSDKTTLEELKNTISFEDFKKLFDKWVKTEDKNITDSLLEKYKNELWGKLLKEIANNRSKNRIEGYFAVRLAYRLFDGSYIHYSQPIIARAGYDIKKPNFCFYHMAFTSYGLLMPENQTFEKVNVIYSFCNEVDYNLQNLVNSGIVKSIDVFSTRVISTFDCEKEITLWAKSEGEIFNISGSLGAKVKFYPPFQKDLIEKLPDEGQYYKVGSIDLSALIRKDIKLNLSGSVTLDYTKEVSTNELLPPDDFTHHTYLSGTDYNYNERLHLGSIKTKLGKGLDNIFYKKMTYYNPFLGEYQLLYAYNHPLLQNLEPASAEFEIHQQIFLHTEDGDKVVSSKINSTYPAAFANGMPSVYAQYCYTTNSEKYFVLNSLIAYPDYRAYKIRYIYRTNLPGWGTLNFLLGEFSLKPNTATNTAYYFEGIDYDTGNSINKLIFLKLTTYYDDKIDDVAINDFIQDKNRMQVSDQNNPFIYPAKNSYRFGRSENEILNIIVAQTAMSDAAFGFYPLYVFTETGIFTIRNGEDSLYSSVQHLNNEIIIKDTLLSISGAIVFATTEGIKIMSGSALEDISDTVEGKYSNPVLQLPEYAQTLSQFGLSSAFTNFNFIEYLKKDKIVLLFDKNNNEIILSNNDTYNNISYVYSLNNKTWSTRTQKFNAVLGAKGAARGVKKYKSGSYTIFAIFDVLNEDNAFSENCKNILLQTRPMQIESTRTKKFFRAVFKSYFKAFASGDKSYMFIFGSNNLKTWDLLNKISAVDGLDIFSTRFDGHYKFFIFAFLSGNQTNVERIDLIFKDEYEKLYR